MALFGYNWKEEEAPEDAYNSIMGGQHSFKDEKELNKQIERDLESGDTSRYEYKNLLKLQERIKENPAD
jgi:hypothetical protein